MDLIEADTLTADSGNDPAVVAAAVADQRPHLTIKPQKGWIPVDLGEMWQFRDLLFALAGRDVKLRYKQTALGVVWVVLQPLLTAGILSFVFGMVAHLSSGSVPYFPFVFAGQMAWGLFSNVLTKAGGSLVGNAHLISKVFFPRLILPLSTIFSALVDFSIALVMMFALLGIYHMPLSWNIVLLPVWLIMLLIAATGAGLVATSLMVSYRDVQYVVPVALQILQYATPIAYAATQVPAKYMFYYRLNPLCSVFEAIRWSVFGTGQLDCLRLGYAGAASVLMLIIGVVAFKKMEQKFADVI